VLQEHPFGIVHVHQAEPITEALIRERLFACDRFLAPLVLT
jgi:hypothetical protein